MLKTDLPYRGRVGWASVSDHPRYGLDRRGQEPGEVIAGCRRQYSHPGPPEPAPASFDCCGHVLACGKRRYRWVDRNDGSLAWWSDYPVQFGVRQSTESRSRQLRDGDACVLSGPSHPSQPGMVCPRSDGARRRAIHRRVPHRSTGFGGWPVRGIRGFRHMGSVRSSTPSRPAPATFASSTRPTNCPRALFPRRSFGSDKTSNARKGSAVPLAGAR